MVSPFGSPDPNWQFARELAACTFTTRPLPISNFCTYAKIRANSHTFQQGNGFRND